ncbi:MAG: hypothetical protein IPJ69_11365 [Deltaproteobacteria bacterium]|nr:MAG: hypothetical protein IPJ69_11365 [Deltaproteobacteria bacterium]
MTLVRKIHIGDSGFREIFGDGFTLEKLNAIMLALAELKPRQKVVVGYDNRFLSEEIAHHIAKILTAQNWNVRVISGTFPTPGVATLVKEWQQDFGLMVTASHNPYYYNGVKIFNESAALISRPFIRSLETLAEEKLNSSAEIPFEVGWRNSDSVSSLDARRVYFDSLLKNVQVPLIQKKKLRVAWDAFGGTDQVLFPLLLKKLQTRQFGLWMEPEPTFHLRRLEPDKTSLKKLGSLVREKKTIVGLATDVDGDRFSILKENGFYILNNQLMSLLTWYLLDVRKEKGNFIRLSVVLK